MIHNPARITEFRNNMEVLAKRTRDLRDRITNTAYRARLDSIVDSFEEIPALFFHDLGTAVRTPQQEDRLISYAVMAATLAQMRLQEEETLVAKYGPNLQAL